MKINAEYIKKTINENGKVEITLETSRFELEKGAYIVDFKKKGTDRSLNQNSLLWALIGAISKQENIDDTELYCQLLEMASAKFEYMMVLPEALELLKTQFRAIQVKENRQYNNKDMLVVKVYYGSSTFNTKEMNLLIDKAIEYANQYNVDVERLKGLYDI